MKVSFYKGYELVKVWNVKTPLRINKGSPGFVDIETQIIVTCYNCLYTIGIPPSPPPPH